jgi:hypothetical protein
MHPSVDEICCKHYLLDECACGVRLAAAAAAVAAVVDAGVVALVGVADDDDDNGGTLPPAAAAAAAIGVKRGANTVNGDTLAIDDTGDD